MPSVQENARPSTLLRTRRAIARLSDERDRWEQFALNLARFTSRRAYAQGWKDGYEVRALELDAAWNRAARSIANPGPPFSELELRRWGPNGREHFGDPQPGEHGPFTRAHIDAIRQRNEDQAAQHLTAERG